MNHFRVPLQESGNHRPSENGFITGRRSTDKFLRKLDRLEDFARKYDDFEVLYGKDFLTWQVPIMRERFVNTYLKVTGIHPSERHDVRARLLGHHTGTSMQNPQADTSNGQANGSGAATVETSL